MNYLEVKSIVLPVEEGIATAQRLLSEKEARKNLRLFRQMERIQIRLAELKGIAQRLRWAEKKEEKR